MKKISVELHKLTITSEHTGKSYSVETVRTAEELAGYVEESEKEAVQSKLQEAVCEAYGS